MHDIDSLTLIRDFVNEYMDNTSGAIWTEITDTVLGINEDWIDNLTVYWNSIDDNYDVNRIVEELHLIQRDWLIALLKNIGVFVSQEHPLDNHTLFTIYMEFIQIENNELAEISLSILQSDNYDDITLFYELLTVVGSLQVDEEVFSSHVASISPYTKEKLISYILNQESVKIKQDEHDVDTDLIVKTVQAFLEAVNDDKFYVIDLIRNGVNIGLPFASYLTLFGTDLFDLDDKELAYNLFLLSAISEEGHRNITGWLEADLMNWIPDYRRQDTIIRMVREVSIHVTNKVGSVTC